MKNRIQCILILITAILATISNVCAETYRWTDADGAIHFSDSPGSVPKEKRSPVPDERVSAPPSQSPLVQRKQKLPAHMPGQACMGEIEKAAGICGTRSQSFAKECFRERLSPGCFRKFDAGQGKGLDEACRQELKDVAVPCS